MAQNTFGVTRVNFPNSLKANGFNTASGINTPTNYASVGNMRTRLAAINGTYYTSAMLDIMSVNDMVYALRMSDDKTTISDYQS